VLLQTTKKFIYGKLVSLCLKNKDDITGVASNFDWRGLKLEKNCDIILVTFFSNLMVMISLK